MCYSLPMNQISVTIKPTSKGRKVLVELDADRLERLAANLGLYNPAFVESIERAERDFRTGHVRTISTLKEIRRKVK